MHPTTPTGGRRQQSIAWAYAPEPVRTPMSWTRVLLDSSTRAHQASRPVGAWTVERSTVDRYLRLLLLNARCAASRSYKATVARACPSRSSATRAA